MEKELTKYNLGTVIEIKNFIYKNKQNNVILLDKKEKISNLFEFLKEEIKSLINNNNYSDAIKLHYTFPFNNEENITINSHPLYSLYVDFKKWAESENLEINFFMISEFNGLPKYPILVFNTKKTYLENVNTSLFLLSS